ncbi:NADP oxidoreductase coenzyme F420-dependent [Leptospira ryugenii]|uniref:NADP oxidoreductase coenzyme F420-dependent n=1 Tax=Leptospira ryugenii TaxID=1917863 RepID=A0A2P2E1K1_9LEPT|nr:NAD(P)-binding domain-containing protein [Leptospira ryugenii]GBF50759.1 NADP oxidoreductase coenzyme F420-dependent [Leptospira ryugenii]
MKIGILGSGVVGNTLADGFINKGFMVIRGTRDPDKLKDWEKRIGQQGKVTFFKEAAEESDLVVLAVKGSAAEEIVKDISDSITGKCVLDATNPISNDPPVNGVLSFFTSLQESLMERLQKISPEALFVKAFSCVGSSFMVDPKFQEGKPTMFICGNDEKAKIQANTILQSFGWEVEDLGKAEAARAIEPLCILWCLPGFLHNRWNHAFRLLKK